MIAQIGNVYATYKGDSGRHKLRITLAAFSSIIIGLLGRPIVDQTFPVVSLIVSVLTGFTFTALFSEPSVRAADLPPPRDENDRRDILDLRELGSNFRKRARLFLSLAIFLLLAITALCIKPAAANLCKISLNNQLMMLFCSDAIGKISNLSHYIFDVLTAIVIFSFIEYLYTFYRMSETILAILDIRVHYLEQRTDP